MWNIFQIQLLQEKLKLKLLLDIIFHLSAGRNAKWRQCTLRLYIKWDYSIYIPGRNIKLYSLYGEKIRNIWKYLERKSICISFLVYQYFSL